MESEEIDVDNGMAPMGPMGREVLMIGGCRGGGSEGVLPEPVPPCDVGAKNGVMEDGPQWLDELRHASAARQPGPTQDRHDR